MTLQLGEITPLRTPDKQTGYASSWSEIDDDRCTFEWYAEWENGYYRSDRVPRTHRLILETPGLWQVWAYANPTQRRRIENLRASLPIHEGHETWKWWITTRHTPGQGTTYFIHLDRHMDALRAGKTKQMILRHEWYIGPRGGFEKRPTEWIDPAFDLRRGLAREAEQSC